VIDELESLKFVDGTIGPSLAEKIQRLSPKLQERLVGAGLVRRVEKTRTLKELFDEYCGMKLRTVNPRSVRNYRSTLRQIEKHLGQDRQIDTITQGCVTEFIAEVAGKSNSTIGNYLKRGAEAFKFAVQKKWITENPFQNLDERKKYPIKLDQQKKQKQVELLTDESLTTLLTCHKTSRSDAENREWNALVAILRWSGCRIAEALILRWVDVGFDKDEIRLRGKRTGGSRASVDTMTERVMPLWAPLVPVLTELKAHASEGTSHLFNHIGGLGEKPEFDLTKPDGTVIRSGRWSTNLATTFKKILRRNKITPWPQPFHGIRRFRINEMERDTNLRTVEVREWTGNSEATAQGFYSSVTREDRVRASQPNARLENGSSVAARSNQTGSDRIVKKTDRSNPLEKQRSETIRDDLNLGEVHPRGFEEVPKTQGKSRIRNPVCFPVCRAFPLGGYQVANRSLRRAHTRGSPTHHLYR
jgi:integrase